MRLIFSLLLVALFAVNAFSQNYIPPSPDALGLAKFANSSVNYYSGAQSTAVPLAQLSSKELAVSVAIIYNGTGLKVQEEASSVGLGWSLSAGGMITRMVKGLPDELPDGYCGVNNRGEMANYQTVPTQFEYNVAAGMWDGEPDIFFFSFMGRGGKFFLDANGIAHVMPYQDLVIRPAICNGGRTEWEIIDENGVRYYFGGTNYTETSSYRKVSPTNSPSTNYVSTWHLRRVESPNSTDYLDFTYTSGGASEFINYFFTKDEPGTVIKDESTRVTVSTRIVSQINSPSGRIEFSWVSGRLDYGGVFLNNVTTYNLANLQIAKTRLEYSYFQAPSCPDNRFCKRLRLDRLFDLAPDPVASFDYNTTQNLPAKNSPNIDHWGYYNSNTVNTWLPASSCSGDEVLNFCWGHGHSFSGASREPDAEKVKANLLIQINQRGGGYQRFNYEIHQAKDISSTIVPVGGVRINAVEYSSGTGPVQYKYFNYIKGNPSETSGLVYYRPVYYAFYYISGTSNFRRFSHSLTSTFDLNGTSVGYERVEEVIAGQGKVVYHFTNPQSGLYDLGNPAVFPVSPADWLRGSLIKTETYSNGGQLLSVQKLEYDEMPVVKSIKSFITNAINGATYSYNLVSVPYKNIEQSTETYDPTNIAKKITIIASHEYDPATYQLINTTTYNQAQSSKKYINKIRYSSNQAYDNILWNGRDCEQERADCYGSCGSEEFYCGSYCDINYNSCVDSPPIYSTPMERALYLMRMRHQTNVPLETISLYTDGTTTKVLSASVNKFKTIGTTHVKVVPAESWTMKSPGVESAYTYSVINSSRQFVFDEAKFRKMMSYDTYDDATANLTEQTSLNGLVQTQMWSADGLLPLSSSITTTGMPARQTSYTFKPMVGQTSVTNANGKGINYEYDVYNRLSMVKDGTEVLKRYRYHYKNETPGFVIATKKEVYKDEVFYVAVTDIAASAGGTPSFVWDMDDGRVVDNNTTNFTHSYSATGNYTIKLTGLNPEYGPATRTAPIGVYTHMQGVSICENGPILIDLCNQNPVTFGPCTTDPNDTRESPTILTANPYPFASGCPSEYTYYWEYKLGQNGYWQFLDTGSQVTAYIPFSETDMTIRCTITDGCGESVVGETTLSSYKSDSECSAIIR
jgi:hypothetical protein